MFSQRHSVAIQKQPEQLDLGLPQLLLRSPQLSSSSYAISSGQHYDMPTFVSATLSERSKFLLPPLAEQKAIAAVLGALDDKIELNRRMNATLEAMARALFQSWFVDFDPVRAKLDGRQPTGLDPATAALFPNEFEDSELGPIPKRLGSASVDEILV